MKGKFVKGVYQPGIGEIVAKMMGVPLDDTGEICYDNPSKKLATHIDKEMTPRINELIVRQQKLEQMLGEYVIWCSKRPPV